MYEISDYQNKSERVRRLMLLDDVEENAALYAHQIASDFSDAHFCNRTRVVLEGLDEEACERGITLDDSLKGEIQGIYNHQVKLALWDAGFKDIRDVVQGGKHWIEFYKYWKGQAMKEEYVTNRAQVLNDFRRRFGIKSDVISPDFFCDMLHHYKWLRDAWDKACELDRQHNI